MTVLTVSEFKVNVFGPRSVKEQTDSFELPPLAENPVSITASSVQSAAFTSQTNAVRINAKSACSIAVGANPTATTNNLRLAADQTETFFVTPGHKIAVIAN